MFEKDAEVFVRNKNIKAHVFLLLEEKTVNFSKHNHHISGLSPPSLRYAKYSLPQFCFACFGVQLFYGGETYYHNSVVINLIVADKQKPFNTWLRSPVRIAMSTEISTEKVFNPREEVSFHQVINFCRTDGTFIQRRKILKSPNYNRMGFKEEKADVEEMMVKEFTSPLVAELRANKGTIVRGDITVRLAEYYGFCWGVERAVRMRPLAF